MAFALKWTKPAQQLTVHMSIQGYIHPFFEDHGGDYMMNAATKQEQSSELAFPLDSTLTSKSLTMRRLQGKDIII